LLSFLVVHVFGYSEQLDTCCEALVAQSSPDELNHPPILKAALCGLFSYTPPQYQSPCYHLTQELCAAFICMII
ncbi:TPA: hypothetical protein ACT91W_003896, partial [Morganella morganii]